MPSATQQFHTFDAVGPCHVDSRSSLRVREACGTSDILPRGETLLAVGNERLLIAFLTIILKAKAGVVAQGTFLRAQRPEQTGSGLFFCVWTVCPLPNPDDHLHGVWAVLSATHARRPSPRRLGRFVRYSIPTTISTAFGPSVRYPIPTTISTAFGPFCPLLTPDDHLHGVWAVLSATQSRRPSPRRRLHRRVPNHCPARPRVPPRSCLSGPS